MGTQNGESCVGWATGYYLRTFQQAKDIGWKVKMPDGSKIYTHVFSPSFIYNQINNGVDRGAYMKDACTLLQNTGAATLADFPDIPTDHKITMVPQSDGQLEITVNNAGTKTGIVEDTAITAGQETEFVIDRGKLHGLLRPLGNNAA